MRRTGSGYAEGMRRVGLLAIAAAALVACGSGSAGALSGTSLKITYWGNGIDRSEPVAWTLRCGPPRGTLARPAVACRRLATAGTKLFAPVPSGVACTQIYGGPQVARVVGVVSGKRVFATFSRQDGCRIARWNKLSPWLLPPGGVTS